MNPFWGLLFKDRIRTPFSVYKMSVAEVVVLAAIIFGTGFGVVKGGQWLMNTFSYEQVVEVETQ